MNDDQQWLKEGETIVLPKTRHGLEVRETAGEFHEADLETRETGDDMKTIIADAVRDALGDLTARMDALESKRGDTGGD